MNSYQKLFWFVLSIVVIFNADAYSALISDGYFKGKQIYPTKNADMKLITTEPSVVFVFESSAETIEESKKFNDWYRTASANKTLSLWGLVKVPQSTSKELVEEALYQRNLEFPVFYTYDNYLDGTQTTILLISNSKIQKAFNTINDSEISQAIRSLSPVLPSGESDSSTTVAMASSDALQNSSTDTQTIINDLKSVSSDTVATSSLPQSSAKTTEVTSGYGTYYNNQFAFSVQFPDLWNWIESVNQDGAVGKNPQSRVIYRAWGAQLSDMYQSRPISYVQTSLKNLEKQTANPVVIERELIVSFNGSTGSDVIYTFSRPVNPSNMNEGFLRFKGRIQVFIINGVIKAVSAEAPINEFTMHNVALEAYFNSFDPSPIQH